MKNKHMYAKYMYWHLWWGNKCVQVIFKILFIYLVIKLYTVNDSNFLIFAARKVVEDFENFVEPLFKVPATIS